MSTSHLDRKELKRPDAFLEGANSIVDFINNNSRAILAVLALLLVAGAGLATYANHAAKQGEAAENAFYDARHALAAQLSKDAPAKAPGADAAAPTAPTYPSDWDSKAKDSIERVEKIARDFSGTRAAFEANMLLGDIFFVRKQPARAVEYFTRAVAAATPRSAKPSAQYALGYALEATKDYDKAAEAFRAVTGSGDAVLKADGMLGLGRTLALKGDKSKALDVYTQVSKEFPNSVAAKSAEAQASQLK